MAEWTSPLSKAQEMQWRIHALQNQNNGQAVMDAQELEERQEAAQEYAGENEKHFVDYVRECVTTSRQAMTRIRQVQNECWQVYQEDEPPNYADKEAWQSRVVVPKPHSAVQFACAQVRKAFSVQFLSIKNAKYQKVADFWDRLMTAQLDRNHADFIISFVDAVQMSFAIGQSMEMIPYWVPGQGLKYDLIEPWKIHRDPDALSRNPQSGMYWIHEEFQDLWTLRKGQEDGQYQNVHLVQADAHNPENPDMDPENQAERKKMFWTRNRFRQTALTREFWGTVLDSKGNLLLPSATYTVAGNRVIALPTASTYATLRWPGVSFSPLPHLLRYDGRSLLHGIRTLWYFMCSLLTLHNDNLNWIVNPMTEIQQNGLIDQDDLDPFPGRTWVTRETMNGQQVVRTVDRRFISGEILPNLQYGDQLFQTGTMVNSTVQGLPGYRAEITAREQAQHLDQSLTVFGSMGINLEAGALHAIQAGVETVMANITMAELSQLMTDEDMQLLQDPSLPMQDIADGRVPQLQGVWSVAGLSAALEDVEKLKTIEQIVMPMAASPVFLPYMKPYRILQVVETAANLTNEKLFCNEDEAKLIAENQGREVEAQKEAEKAIIQAQIQAEAQKNQLEAQKIQLDGQKLQLEAEKLGLEARKMQAAAAMEELKLEGEQVKLEGEHMNLEAEQALADREIARVQAEIARVMSEIQRVQYQAEAEAAKVTFAKAILEFKERESDMKERESDMKIRVLQAQVEAKRRSGATT